MQWSGHGTGLLSPKQSGMDRPSASACLKGKAGKDKETKQTTFGRETLFIHQARLVSDVRMSGGSNGLNKPRMYIYFQSRLVKSRLNVSMGRSQDSRVSDCCEHLSDWSINEIIFFHRPLIYMYIFFL